MVCHDSEPSHRSIASAHVRLDTFTSLADGKLNGQKAFMTGAINFLGDDGGTSRAQRYVTFPFMADVKSVD